MYVPTHFSETRIDVLHDLIRENPLGILMTNGKSGLDANHIPFLIDSGTPPFGVLHCHVARANPAWQDIATGDEVLVVFRADHAYISPNWYPSKQEFHKQVPTWNYRVAHAHGRVTIRDDERYIRTLVARLTKIHESNLPTPWKMSDAPRDYIDMMVRAVVGIEIEITRLTGKSKLGQNKEERDIKGAAAGLKERGEHALGDVMLAALAAKLEQN